MAETDNVGSAEDDRPQTYVSSVEARAPVRSMLVNPLFHESDDESSGQGCEAGPRRRFVRRKSRPRSRNPVARAADVGAWTGLGTFLFGPAGCVGAAVLRAALLADKSQLAHVLAVAAAAARAASSS
mmetsp:Transcript_5983/g.11426  ORF Transcript_5983/g.11426 Transcript_5983/m.11426 type:complete len:127 (-) Transcript_5983:235-615(-)